MMLNRLLLILKNLYLAYQVKLGFLKKQNVMPRKILEYGQKKGITSGKHPMSMAAAAVYLAIQDNHEKVSQTKLAQISGISAVTIRNRVKELQIPKRNHE